MAATILVSFSSYVSVVIAEVHKLIQGGIWTPCFQCDDLIVECMVEHSLQMEQSQPEQILFPLQMESESQ